MLAFASMTHSLIKEIEKIEISVTSRQKEKIVALRLA